jgi:hypothetical protein
MCIKRVGEYLESKGTLPFIVSAQGFKMHKQIRIIKRDSTDVSCTLEISIPPQVFKVDAGVEEGAPSPDSRPTSAITIALPAKTFSGAAITLKTKNGSFKVKVIKSGLLEKGIISNATGLVLEFSSDPSPEVISAALSIVPAKAGVVTLNEKTI